MVSVMEIIKGNQLSLEEKGDGGMRTLETH